MRIAALLLTLSVLLSACDGEDGRLGVDQPIFVHNAELRDGKLPGKRSGEPDAERAQITSFSLGFGVLNPGTPNVTVNGRVSGDAYAVGVRFLELGDGYWVVPAGSEDPTNPGELIFDISFDAAMNLKPGLHDLAVVAFDERGRAGSQSVLRVCVGSPVPDNLNACNPETAPPEAVASLTWNIDADLDLIIIAPDGRRFDRNNRLLLQDGKLDASGKPLAGLDIDGSTGCLVDGRKRENFVWNAPPQKGTWLAYANFFDACGKPAVSFELTLYRRRRKDDGTYELKSGQVVRGEFVRGQQNGGRGQPLYITPIQF